MLAQLPFETQAPIQELNIGRACISAVVFSTHYIASWLARVTHEVDTSKMVSCLMVVFVGCY